MDVYKEDFRCLLDVYKKDFKSSVDVYEEVITETGQWQTEWSDQSFNIAEGLPKEKTCDHIGEGSPHVIGVNSWKVSCQQRNWDLAV